jgi:hypothetical protein
MRVVQKFFIASLFMWAVPIALLYAFNHNLLPGKILKYLCFLLVCVFPEVGVDLYSYLCPWYFFAANLIGRPSEYPLSEKMYVKMSYNVSNYQRKLCCLFYCLLAEEMISYYFSLSKTDNENICIDNWWKNYYFNAKFVFSNHCI